MDKLNRGLREYQTEKSMESQLSILSVLSYDEDWHQYSEIREKTRLSDTTLTKQLKRLKKIKLIERNLDTESGKYPYPVSYRLNPDYVNAFRGSYRKEEVWETMQKNLRERRNLLAVMEEISKHNSTAILGILISIKENRHIDDKIQRLLLELLLWKPYKSLIWSLIEEARRIFGIQELKEFVWDA
jgi:DNA-binding HxlR family transcriptional regulator